MSNELCFGYSYKSLQLQIKMTDIVYYCKIQQGYNGYPSVVLILLYLATLIKVLQGSRNIFAIKIIAILLCANLSNVIAVIFIGWNENKKICLDNWGYFIFWMLYNMLFGIAHWIFAYEYYKNAYQTPFVLEGKIVPQKRENIHAITYWIFMVLNIVIPICMLWLTFYPIMSLLQAVSGWLMLYSVAIIYKYLKERVAYQYINTKLLLFHAGSFTIYIISQILMTSFAIYWYGDYTKQEDTSSKLIMLAEVICCFLTQIIFCVVFWRFGKIQPQSYRRNSVNYLPIEVEGWTDEVEKQKVIWNQFISQSTDSQTSSDSSLSDFVLTNQKIYQSIVRKNTLQKDSDERSDQKAKDQLIHESGLNNLEETQTQEL